MTAPWMDRLPTPEEVEAHAAAPAARRPQHPTEGRPAMNLKLFSEPVLSDGELPLFGLLVVGVVVIAAYVVALLALAVLFWRHGAPALCAATLILAAEVLRQTVAAVRMWPC